MSTTDVMTWQIETEQARTAWLSGDFGAARRLVESVLAKASPGVPAYQEAEELSRHLDEVELLQRIAQEADPRRREALLQEALGKKLRFDLRLDPLDKLLTETRAAVCAAADRQARALIEEGDRALEQRGFEDARRAYQDAESVSDLSPDMQKEAAERLRQLDEAVATHNRVQALLDRARPLLESKDYRSALPLLQEAHGLRPGDPEVLPLLEEAEEGQRRIERVEELLIQAEELQAEEPRDALARLDEAQKLAQDIGLEPLIQRIGEIRTPLEERVRGLGERAKTLAAKGEKAEKDGRFDEALRLFQESLRLDPANETASAGQSRIREREEKLAGAKRLKEDGQDRLNARDWEGALRVFQEAQRLNPDDSDLPPLIEEAKQRQRDAETIRLTIGVGISEFNTPSELNRFRQDIPSLVGDTEVDTVDEKLCFIFRREATAKLRKSLAPALAAIDAGNLDDALSIYEQVLPEWEEYAEKNRELQSLRRRLQIARQQQADVLAARDAHEEIRPDLEMGNRALEERKYREAFAAYDEVLTRLEEVPTPARYMLGDQRDRPDDGRVVGILRRFYANLARAARRYGRQVDSSLAEKERLFRSRLEAGEISAAEETLGPAFQTAQLLRQAKERFDEYAPFTLPAPWPTQPWWETFEQLRSQLTEARKEKTRLEEGWECLGRGDLAAARAIFEEFDSNEARAGLELIAELEPLLIEIEKARQEGRVADEIESLGQVLVLFPRSHWARERQRELTPLREKQRSTELQIEGIRAAIEAHRFESALRQCEEMLRDLPGDEAWAYELRAQLERLKRQAEDGEAGIKRREELRLQAEEALREGDYEAAARLAGEIPGDPQAERILHQAEQVQKMVDEALEYLEREEYEEAERSLKHARRILSPAVSPRLDELWKEVQTGLSEQRTLDTLLRQARDAADCADWVTALTRAEQVLGKSPGHSDAEQLRARAIGELKEVARQALSEKDFSRSEEAVQALRHCHVDDAEVRDLVRRVERARELNHLRRQVEYGRSSELQEAIRRLEEPDLRWRDDPEFKDLYKRARLRLLLRRVQEAEGQLDWQSAVAALEDARELDPGNRDIAARLERGRIELALSASARLLQEEEVQWDEAQAVLHRLGPVGDPRVQKRLKEIDELQADIGDADRLRQEGKVGEAVAKLDKILRRRPAFPMAIARRQKIVEDLLERGKQCEEDGDLWGALQAYQTLQQISSSTETNLRRVRASWGDHLSDLRTRVVMALEDPNLDLRRCGLLIDELRNIPPAEQRRHSTLSEHLAAMEERKDELTLLSPLIPRIRQELEEAHRTGRYDGVEQLLQQIGRINSLFNGRREVREVRREMEFHRSRRDRMRKDWQRYRQALELLEESVTSPSPNLEAIGEFLREGEQTLTQVVKLNRSLKELDPDDRYGFRNWRDRNKPDPLNVEYRRFQKQVENLKEIGSALLEGVRLREQAEERAEEARKKYEGRSGEQEYEDAQRSWEETANLYDQAAEKLEEVGLLELLTPWATALAGLAQRIAEPLGKEAETARKEAHKIGEELAQIQGGMEKAREAYDDRHWLAAIHRCDEVLALCPRYERAQLLKTAAEDQIKDASRRRSRRLLVGFIGGLAAIGLVVWFFGRGPGYAWFGSTPTPAPTFAPIVTRPPTDTPLPTDTPTTTSMPTPTPTSTSTPTRTPIPTPTPQPCILIMNGWVRDKPSDGGIGLALLKEGQQVGIIDTLENNEGRWYRLAGFGPEAYIRATVVRCTTP